MKTLNLFLLILALVLVFGCGGPVNSPTAAVSTTITPFSAPTTTPASSAPETTVPNTTIPSPTPANTVTPPPTSEAPYTVHGSFETVEGVPILRVWGSHYDMGYATGYFCAEKIVEYGNDTFNALVMDGSNPTYEDMVERLHHYTVWDESYLEEAEGTLDGLEAALGSLPVFTNSRIKAGSKQLDTDMFLFFNCLANILNVEQWCSAFAAWGEATGDGKVRAGGNVELPDRSGASQWIVIVRQPDEGMRTVTLCMVGSFLGMIFKGMNEQGLVFSNQAAYGIYSPVGRVTEAGYTDAIQRDILEQVGTGPDMVNDLKEFFTNNKSIFAGALLFVQKNYTTGSPEPDRMAVVVEKDASGFDFRLPSYNSLSNTPLQDAIFVTNHFLYRQVSIPAGESADRYMNMVNAVVDRPVYGLQDMQRVLQSTNGPAIHSMFFEPDTLTIHVGYGTVDGPFSYLLTPVTFTWEELFAPMPEKS